VGGDQTENGSTEKGLVMVHIWSWVDIIQGYLPDYADKCWPCGKIFNDEKFYLYYHMRILLSRGRCQPHLSWLILSCAQVMSCSVSLAPCNSMRLFAARFLFQVLLSLAPTPCVCLLHDSVSSSSNHSH